MGFADQEMNVFRHQDLAADYEFVADTHCFWRSLKEVSRRRGAEVRETVITTEVMK